MKYTNVNIKSVVRAEDLFTVIYINCECDYYEYYSSKREFDIFAKYLAGGDFDVESVHMRVMARCHAWKYMLRKLGIPVLFTNPL